MSALIDDGKGGKIIWCRNCEKNILRLDRWLGIKLKRDVRNGKRCWLITGRYRGVFEIATNPTYGYDELILFFAPGKYDRMMRKRGK